MKVKLTGKTKHGKNRIAQHGAVWNVIGHGSFRGRSAWMLESLDTTMGGFADGIRIHDKRWVHKDNDNDFDWVIVDE